MRECGELIYIFVLIQLVFSHGLHLRENLGFYLGLISPKTLNGTSILLQINFCVAKTPILVYCAIFTPNKFFVMKNPKLAARATYILNQYPHAILTPYYGKLGIFFGGKCVIDLSVWDFL